MPDIVKHPDDFLRRRAQPVGSYVDEARPAIKAMESAMLENDAAGIAAPQIGVNARIILIAAECKFSQSTGAYIAMIDPVVTDFGEIVNVKTFESEEGCLSIPGVTVKVPRLNQIGVAWTDPYGKWRDGFFDGREAAVIQHEIDHLNGKLIIDYQKDKSE